MKHLTLTAAAALALMLALPQSAPAQGFSFSFGSRHDYALRFSPQAMTLRPGQKGSFRIQYTKRGVARTSPMRDFRVSVSPRDASLQISRSGSHFEFVAQRPGLYRIDARHDSARAYKGARGSMTIRVNGFAPAPRPRPRPDHGHHDHGQHGRRLASLQLLNARTGQALSAHRVMTLTEGERLSVKAVGLDRFNRPIEGLQARFELNTPRAGELRQRGNRALLTAGAASRYRMLYLLTARVGRHSQSVRFIVGRSAHEQPAPRVHRVELQQQLPCGTWQTLAPGATLRLRRGQRLNLRALGYCARGSRVRFDASWSQAGSRGLAWLSRNGSQATLSAGWRSGRMTLIVRDAASGTRALVRVLVNL